MERSSDTHSAHEETPRSRQSLGNLLKEARKSKGMSLEDISEATGIGVSKLQSLEEGERRGLPADVFVRGFIRIISAQIDVDPQVSLELFEREWGAKETDADATLLQGEVFAKSSVILKRWPAIVTIVVLSIAVYLAAQFFFPALFIVPPQQQGEILSNELPEIKIVSKSQTQPDTSPTDENSIIEQISIETEQPVKNTANQKSTEEEPVASTLSPITTPKEDAIPTNNSATESTPGPTETSSKVELLEETVTSVSDMSDEITHYTLHVQFTERTWVKISIDGQDPYEEIFKRNSEKTWDADKSIDLYLGNAGGVKITLNGEPMPLKQESGQTVRLQIP